MKGIVGSVWGGREQIRGALMEQEVRHLLAGGRGVDCFILYFDQNIKCLFNHILKVSQKTHWYLTFQWLCLPAGGGASQTAY